MKKCSIYPLLFCNYLYSMDQNTQDIQGLPIQFLLQKECILMYVVDCAYFVPHIFPSPWYQTRIHILYQAILTWVTSLYTQSAFLSALVIILNNRLFAMLRKLLLTYKKQSSYYKLVFKPLIKEYLGKKNARKTQEIKVILH